MKKILIIYATAGIGHAKAARAVKKVFDEMKPEGAEAVLIDSLTYMTGYFRKSYLDTYLCMVKDFATIWGLFYFITDNRYVDIVVSKLRRYFNWLHSRPFVRYLREYDPDVVISTHFLANEVISNLKSKGLIRAKLITVVTDYRLHAFWIAPRVDMYVVGSREAEDDLARRGVPKSRVRLLGIPVEPEFTRPVDRDSIISSLGVDRGSMTVLVIGGGFGVGPIESIVKMLDEIGKNTQALVVCGYNEALRLRIAGLASGLKIPVKVYGFINTVYELMQVSDCLISKSGGLTAAEAIVKGLPLAVLSPIPGQESRNCDFLVSNGAAARVDTLGALKDVLRRFTEDPGRLARMRDAIKKIARPRAARDIVELAVKASED